LDDGTTVRSGQWTGHLAEFEDARCESATTTAITTIRAREYETKSSAELADAECGSVATISVTTTLSRQQHQPGRQKPRQHRATSSPIPCGTAEPGSGSERANH